MSICCFLQGNPGGKTLEERRSSLDAEIDSLTSILADLECSSPYKPRPPQVRARCEYQPQIICNYLKAQAASYSPSFFFDFLSVYGLSYLFNIYMCQSTEISLTGLISIFSKIAPQHPTHYKLNLLMPLPCSFSGLASVDILLYVSRIFRDMVQHGCLKVRVKTTSFLRSSLHQIH